MKNYTGKESEKKQLMLSLTLALGNPINIRKEAIPPDYVTFRDNSYNAYFYVFLMREIGVKEVERTLRKQWRLLIAIENQVAEISKHPSNMIKSMILETLNSDYVGIIFSKNNLFS